MERTRERVLRAQRGAGLECPSSIVAACDAVSDLWPTSPIPIDGIFGEDVPAVMDFFLEVERLAAERSHEKFSSLDWRDLEEWVRAAEAGDSSAVWDGMAGMDGMGCVEDGGVGSAAAGAAPLALSAKPANSTQRGQERTPSDWWRWRRRRRRRRQERAQQRRSSERDESLGPARATSDPVCTRSL